MSLKEYLAEAAEQGGHLMFFVADDGGGAKPFVAFKDSKRLLDHESFDLVVDEASRLCGGQRVATVVRGDLLPPAVAQGVIRWGNMIASVDHGGFAVNLTYFSAVE